MFYRKLLAIPATFLFPLALLSGCATHLSVVQKKVTAKSYASNFVKSPDPELKCREEGKELVFEWVDCAVSKESPHYLEPEILHGNGEVTTYKIALHRKRGFWTYRLTGDEYRQKKGILTYRVRISDQKGNCLKSWEHKLWFHRIDIDDDE